MKNLDFDIAAELKIITEALERYTVASRPEERREILREIRRRVLAIGEARRRAFPRTDGGVRDA